MKANLKILAVAGIALGLAFFFFKKSAQAGEVGAGSVSEGAGGGVVSAIVGGVKKIFGAAKKLFAPAAAADVAGALAGGGAGFSAVASSGAIVTPGGFLVAAPVAAPLGTPIAAGTVVPGSAAGGGAAGALGGAISTVGFFAGFVAFLMALGKSDDRRTQGEIQAEWEKTRLAQTASGWNVGNEGFVKSDVSGETR